MKVLLLNQAFHPDVVSTAQHASDLAAALVQNGHDVIVLCSRRAYDAPQQRYARTDVWKSVRIRRISSLGFGKSTRWRRAADFGSYLANCVLHLATMPRVDIVIGMTSPPLISFLGALFARLKGGRFVFWVMDLNPDEALAAGWLRAGSWTTRSLESLLRYSLRQAHTIIALDRFMAGRIQRKGISPAKILVLPPWSHDHVVRYDAEGRHRFRTDHGLDGKYVVMHSGNHSPCHPLRTLLEAARRINEHHAQIKFCFVGGGSEFATVRRFAAEHALANVVTLPYQPLENLSASLSSADLHVVVMGDPCIGIVHPCKVYNIRTLGIPYLYIGPSDSHVADMSPPFMARHGDVETVVHHILSRAAFTPERAPMMDSVAVHRQDRVVGQMVAALEAAALPAAASFQAIVRTHGTS